MQDTGIGISVGNQSKIATTVFVTFPLHYLKLLSFVCLFVCDAVKIGAQMMSSIMYREIFDSNHIELINSRPNMTDNQTRYSQSQTTLPLM